jgi:hypothetical protein
MKDYEWLAILMGACLLLDDAQDIGKFDRLHHWQAGLGLMALPVVKPRVFTKLIESISKSPE